MANPIHRKLAGILTAAALCTASLPLGGMAVSAGEVTSLEEILCSTAHDDFFQLAQITLQTYASTSVGNGNPLSLKYQILLDVDNSGKIDTGDAYCFLKWYAQYSVTCILPEDAQAFLARWDTAEQTVTTTVTADTTAALEETTISPVTTTTLMLTIQSTEAESTVSVTVPDTTEPIVSASALATETTASVTAETADTSSVSVETATTAATTSIAVATTTTAAVTTTTAAVTTTASLQGAWAQKDRYDGIDVSKYQGNVDWEAVRADGVDFALIRAGYGKYASQEDPYFDQNMRNAKNAGIACGAYWFSYAETAADAKQEAEVFAKVIEGYQFEYPLVFDIEASVHVSMTKEQVSAIISAFCETMEEKGYYISLYSYASFLNDKVYQSVLEKYDIWVAHFGVSTPSYSKTKYGMWQYSSTGSVSGISGNVDLDYSYRCYPNIMTRNHLNGF